MATLNLHGGNIIIYRLNGTENLDLSNVIDKSIGVDDELVNSFTIERTHINPDTKIIFSLKDISCLGENEAIDACERLIKKLYYQFFKVSGSALNYWGHSHQPTGGVINKTFLSIPVIVDGFPDRDKIYTIQHEDLIDLDKIRLPDSKMNAKYQLMEILAIGEHTHRFCSLYEFLKGYMGCSSQDKFSHEMRLYSDEYNIKLDCPSNTDMPRDEFSYLRNLLSHNERESLNKNKEIIGSLLEPLTDKIIKLIINII